MGKPLRRGWFWAKIWFFLQQLFFSMGTLVKKNRHFQYGIFKNFGWRRFWRVRGGVWHIIPSGEHREWTPLVIKINSISSINKEHDKYIRSKEQHGTTKHMVSGHVTFRGLDISGWEPPIVPKAVVSMSPFRSPSSCSRRSIFSESMISKELFFETKRSPHIGRYTQQRGHWLWVVLASAVETTATSPFSAGWSNEDRDMYLMYAPL